MSPNKSSDTTDDAFLGGALKILQPRAGYRAGLDAVLLAAAAPVRAGERVLDAGAGVGVVGLCLATRVSGARVTLVEKQPELVSLAGRNVVRNDMQDRVDVVEADVTGSARALMMAGLGPETFANPPFHVEGQGRRPRNAIKAAAHAMPAGHLARWVAFAARVARPDGTLTIIHRADAMTELLGRVDGRFGALNVLPIHPRAGAPASRILVQGKKGSRAPLTLLPGLILHGDDNQFRPNVAGILRHGEALNLGDKG